MVDVDDAPGEEGIIGLRLKDVVMPLIEGELLSDTLELKPLMKFIVMVEDADGSFGEGPA